MGDIGGGLGSGRATVLLRITPHLFPVKVDQFKSDVKIRNNQVKKNTAKEINLCTYTFFLKTGYIFTESDKIQK